MMMELSFLVKLSVSSEHHFPVDPEVPLIIRLRHLNGVSV